MDFEKFCNALELSGVNRSFILPEWEKLTAGWDGNMPEFLSMDFFKKYYPHCAIPFPLEELLPRAEKVLEITAAHPEAALLAHMIKVSCYELKGTVAFDFMPDILPCFGKEYSGMFSLMISLGACPYIEKSYAELGLPSHCARDTMKWIGGSMHAYAEGNEGRPGRPIHFSWIRLYINKTLFRIGRLEYLLHPYPAWMPYIYRNKAGKLAVLAPDKWQFRADGYRTSDPEKTVFTAQIIETGNTITGTPIAPDGSVDFNNTLTLDKKEYFPVAGPWDACPSLHIPGGSRLDFEEVKKSLSDAVIFFEKYLHREVPLFCCWSWILNPAWEELLDNSNMARFRRECYAVPGPDWGPRAGMSFLFGRDDVAPDTLTAKNSAQKAFIEAFKREKIGIGIIFILTEDIPQLGEEFYRKKAD